MARFVKGQSGNPAGRGRSARVVIQKLLAEHVEQLAEQTLAKALQGDTAATAAILSLYVATLPRPPAPPPA